MKREPVSFDSPEDLTAKAMAAQWVRRLIGIGVPFSSDLSSLLSYIFGNILNIIDLLKIKINLLPDIDIYRSYKHEINNYHNFSNDHIIEQFILSNKICKELIFDSIDFECKNFIKINLKKSIIFPLIRRRLVQIFGISIETAIVLEYCYIKRVYNIIYSYFERTIDISNIANRCKFSEILNIDIVKLNNSITTALSCDLIRGAGNLELSDELFEFWAASKAADVRQLFFVPLAGKGIPLGNFRVPEEDVAHVKALLASPGPDPVNILLYGPPGTGKTSFARSLAAALGVKAWSVASRLQDGDDARRSSLVACLNMASKVPGAFALVDEAERLLDTRQGLSARTKDKAWLNSVLEAPGQRTIWITNDVDHIDQAVRRRFQYSVHFRGLGARERQDVWRQIAASGKARHLLPAKGLEALARDYDVPPSVIEEAVGQARAIAQAKADFVPAVERVLAAHVALREGGRPPGPRAMADPDFRLEGVCLEGKVEDLLEPARRLDARLRGGGEVRPGGGTFLLYGPPGTGKTALARHVAQSVGRECRVVMASDLLDCLVGQTERNMARVFRDSEAEGTVLVIDEVDSFLHGRDLAVRAWEATMVNQFLTCLEDYRGICFCTTNRRAGLDPAAMRRFSFKFEFSYASGERLEALYGAHLAPLAGSGPTGADLRALRSMEGLTPGDFGAVRSRYWLADPGSVGHRELIGALGLELRLKLDKPERTIGFMGPAQARQADPRGGR
jgi:AAA+ superfamily predicted ATPase